MRLKLRTSVSSIVLSAIVIFTACSKKDIGNVPPPNPSVSDMEKIDEMVYSFMSKNAVPGVSLAIAKDGKIVYAKGYGFSDRETGTRMDNQMRSRISSISKTVTAIAIMKLVEQGKISLDDKVFGPGAILGDSFGSVRPYRQHITSLTVKHCLSHHVGGWGNASNDPTSLRNDLDASQLISYIIDNVPLSATPGTSYSYSNVGYMILGRIIESVTQKTYEQFVKEEILQPIGITSMEIGGNTLADQKNKESRYHQTSAYTSNFSRRDANGGWIATASDIVNLMVRADGFATTPDILSPASIQALSTPPFSYKNYGLGLFLNGSTWYHGGSYPGSRSHYVRTSSGMVGTILVNNNSTGHDALLNSIVAASVTWPSQP